MVTLLLNRNLLLAMRHLKFMGIALLLVVGWLTWLIYGNSYAPQFAVPEQQAHRQASATNGSEEAEPTERPEQVESSSSTLPDETNQANAGTSESASSSSGCLTVMDLQSDPRYALLLDWFDVELGFGKSALSDQYALLSESELLEAAELGDPSAMLALGMNYAFFASSEHFVSDKLLLPGATPRPLKPKALDQAILAKAEHWLYQAALHGKLAGLAELKWIAYSRRDAIDKNDENSEALERESTLTFAAYQALMADVMPPQMKRWSSIRNYVQEKHKAEFEQKLASLRQRWDKDRDQLGYAQIVDIDVPQGMLEILALSNNLCDD